MNSPLLVLARVKFISNYVVHTRVRAAWLLGKLGEGRNVATCECSGVFCIANAIFSSQNVLASARTDSLTRGTDEGVPVFQNMERPWALLLNTEWASLQEEFGRLGFLMSVSRHSVVRFTLGHLCTDMSRKSKDRLRDTAL